MLFKMKDSETVRNPSSLHETETILQPFPTAYVYSLLSSVSLSTTPTHTPYLQPLSCFIEAQCYWQCALPLQCSLLVLNYSQQDQLCAICVNFYAITSPNQNQADVRAHRGNLSISMYLDSILLAVQVNISSFGSSSLDPDLINIPVECEVSNLILFCILV